MLTSSGTVRHFGHLAILSGLLVLAGAVCPERANAADLALPVTGNLVGSVVDSDGVPQMGATIQLLNKYHQAIAKAMSDRDGHFAFASLPVDIYSLRASLASFLPVSRDKVNVKAGVNSVLQIHLATLISSVEVSYIVPSAAMTDDWKLVLRTSSATRPVNRYLPDTAPSPSDSADAETSSDRELPARTPLFSQTHASLSVMGGDGGFLDADSSFPDFGTVIAVSTQIYGKNRIQVSGSFGDDGAISTPAIGISAIYSRSDDPIWMSSPEITFSAVQVAGFGAVNSPGASGAPGNPATLTLHSMSLGIYETLDPLANVHLEYGMTGESFDYLQSTNRINPFARVTMDEGKMGQLIAAYFDGGRPDQLLRHRPSAIGTEDESDADMATSSVFLQRLPQISNRNGRLVLQRSRNYELGYTKVAGSRTYSLSGFSEDVNNGRLSVAGSFASALAPDILSDTYSRTSIYNVGAYRRTGYMGSVYQRINDHLEGGLAYGQMGAFQAQPSGSINLGVLPLRQRTSRYASASLKAVLPGVGTRLQADYGWIDSGTVMPTHVFTTQRASAAPGLNLCLRQPVPSFFGLPGRLELTADLRNLLSQGYVPINGTGGRQMLIVQAPQSVRGGLNFIF